MGCEHCIAEIERQQAQRLAALKIGVKLAKETNNIYALCHGEDYYIIPLQDAKQGHQIKQIITPNYQL